jgi:hypothetical protein
VFAAFAPNPYQTVFKTATPQILLKLFDDIARKIFSFPGTRADERTDVILHHLEEQRFFGLAAFVLDGSEHGPLKSMTSRAG